MYIYMYIYIYIYIYIYNICALIFSLAIHKDPAELKTFYFTHTTVLHTNMMSHSTWSCLRCSKSDHFQYSMHHKILRDALGNLIWCHFMPLHPRSSLKIIDKERNLDENSGGSSEVWRRGEGGGIVTLCATSGLGGVSSEQFIYIYIF